MPAPTIDDAINAIRQLSPTRQAEPAAYLLDLAHEDTEPIDPAHREGVLEGLAQVKRDEIATEAEVEAAYRSFDK